MITTAENYLKQAYRSNLVGKDKLKELSAQFAAKDPPKPVAKAMVKENLLTKWQAEQLAAGRKDFRVGRYLLLNPLGSGSKGVVFKVKQEPEDRVCVIKILARNVMNKKGAIDRWYQEVDVITALDHPNIIRSYGADEAEEMHLLVMEFVEGNDLSWWLDEYGRLPVDWSCEVIRQSCLGMQHASDRGVIHRDLKPGNILIQGKTADDFPKVKILDLGYARIKAEKGKSHLRLTRDNEVFGTPKYMAPEQAIKSKDADIRSDIYSLGCTLYKALTGDSPFSVPSGLDIIGNDRKQPPKASQFRGEVPKELENVILKMLAYVPTKRYQTPNDVVAALEPFSMNSR